MKNCKGVAIPNILMFKSSTLPKRYAKANLIRINPAESEVKNKNSIGLSLGGLEGLKALLD
jgi:hypothetical protein